MLYDRANRTMRELTADMDQTTHSVRWLPDSQTVVFMSEYRGTNQLFRMGLQDHQATQVSRGAFNWGLAAVMPGGDQLLVDSQSMLRPKELSLLSIADGSAERVTRINDDRLQPLELPQVTQRWVPASDGKLIHCWVIYPPDFDPHKKWPLITYCQGGPQGQIGQWFSYRWNFHLMAAKGYVIVAPNRRGLPGFGREWNDQISGDWGGQAMQDILAATDAMMVEPYIDTQHMAAVGASFGGYTVYWLMGNHQDRFCCMVAHCGVFNLESMFGATEEIWFPNWDLGGPYWESPAAQRAMIACRRIGSSRTGARRCWSCTVKRTFGFRSPRAWRPSPPLNSTASPRVSCTSRTKGTGCWARRTECSGTACSSNGSTVSANRSEPHRIERWCFGVPWRSCGRSRVRSVTRERRHLELARAGRLRHASSRRTSANFSTASARSSREWAAEICVRMRAFP